MNGALFRSLISMSCVATAFCVCVWGGGGGGEGRGARWGANRFDRPHFDNSFFCWDQPNNYLTSSSLLTLIRQNSAFKHVTFIHYDAYK